MPRQLVSGMIVRAAVYGFLNGQLSINRFHYVVQSGGTGVTTDFDFVTQWNTAINADLRNIMSAASQFLGCTAQIIQPLPVTVRQEDTTAAGAGTGGPTPLPTAVCGIVEWLSPMAGRSGRGRTYYPFPSTADVDVTSQPLGLFVAKMGTLSNAIISFVTVTGVGGVASVQLTLGTRTFAPNFTGFTVHHKWATQHRRGAYGKTNVSPL